MKKNTSLFFGLAILLLSTACQQQAKNPLTSLREENIHSLNMFFYPSTIRMINIIGDSSLHEATKGIKQLHYLSVDLSDSAKAKAYSSWEASQSFDEWEELLRANLEGKASVVYAPQNTSDKFFAIIRTDDGINLLWAEGNVNLKQAMNVMNNGLDLGPLTNYLSNNEKDKKRREVWKKAREEQRRLEEEDSLSIRIQID